MEDADDYRGTEDRREKMAYTDLYNTRRTSQKEFIPGRENDQKVNSAGGVSFKLDAWKKLDRFLILGSDAPTYYASAKSLTKQNAGNIVKLIKEDGVRVVNRVVEISKAGRAYKNDPATFTLALAFAEGDLETKKAARQALSQVARIGTHLFSFVEDFNNLRGWGNSPKKAVANWYTEKDAQKLAYQVTKYQQRNGWSHRDVLRLAHASTSDPQKNAVLQYAVTGELASEAPDYLFAVEEVKRQTDPKRVAEMVRQYNLPREVLPTQTLNSVEVWEALINPSEGRFMPMNAMVRNLGAMTSKGVLQPMGSMTRLVAERLTDADALKYARVHPMQVLAALFTYRNGQGSRGKLSWTPVREILDALDEAFYLSFGAVVPTGKRRLLALDVSGSMTFGEGGYYGYGYGGLMDIPGLSPRVASSALAMVAARTEQQYLTMGFSHYFVDLDFSPRQRLDDILRKTENMSFGGTDCALPMKYALQKKIEVDSFEVYTDSETWAGTPHPVQALDEYKQKMGIDASLVVVGMTANDVSIADPKRADNLDVVGFDTATPNVISDFIRRDL
jgi:60 kDa SS-A/Ro ribonucleoprotein